MSYGIGIRERWRTAVMWFLLLAAFATILVVLPGCASQLLTRESGKNPDGSTYSRWRASNTSFSPDGVATLQDQFQSMYDAGVGAIASVAGGGLGLGGLGAWLLTRRAVAKRDAAWDESQREAERKLLMAKAVEAKP